MGDDLSNLDLYLILEISPDASDKEIVKAYRKKALKCHPDKNPDNPKAAEEFHQLSKALEVLTDAAARAAYDKILKAKKAAELRHRELDSKRKKLKEDLEARERASESGQIQQQKAKRNLQAEIERLRKEGSRLLQEEQERLRTELLKKNSAEDQDAGDEVSGARLKIKWSAKKGDPENGGYSQDTLKQLFSKYGEVTALLVSNKRNGSAIIELASSHAALLAVQNELGLPSNPITITWLSGQPTSNTADSNSKQKDSSDSLQGLAATVPNTTPTPGQPGTTPSAAFPCFSSFGGVDRCAELGGLPNAQGRDFESVVLMRMRQAQERKRLAEQMAKEEEEDQNS